MNAQDQERQGAACVADGMMERNAMAFHRPRTFGSSRITSLSKEIGLEQRLQVRSV